MDRFILISGCSGGGKSSLVDALAARGFNTVSEPGRRIVAEEISGDGANLPWKNPRGFALRLVAVALSDYAAATRLEGPVFFDRGLVDAISALSHATGQAADIARAHRHFCHRQVFMAPPWPEIYVQDAERRHGLSAAMDEYERLAAFYPQLGYDVVALPKTDIAARADFVLARIGF
ncbi:AAA family ATPase [Martelella sp. HB161492]|uniref:AAA family ATPase n=1 Tax=Martelella sp. HB161492 TaxID=2720726 RepID=UPI001591312D|nr:AAA family ATPase [Martelella sp. HB161492]